jgi:hypothetical protein
LSPKSSVIARRQATNEDPAAEARRKREYEIAFEMIEMIDRALTDEGFHDGVAAGYRLSGRQDLATKFTNAVAEQARYNEQCAAVSA